MADLLKIYAIYGDATLKNRITAAIGNISNYILTTEGAGVANHANRLIWAARVILDPEQEANKMIRAVAANTDIQAGIQNGDEAAYNTLVEYVVGVSVDLFATGS